MIDLHVHSTASDGTLTPAQLVARAARLGLAAVSLADHDTTAGVAEAVAAGREAGVTVIPAVEVSVEDGDTEAHVLGYFLDCNHPALVAKLAVIRQSRTGRAEEMVTRLQRLGVEISYQQVQEQARGESVGRPHVAAALVATGEVQAPQEAFDRYLRRGRPAYVPRYKLAPQEAVDLIRAAGGLAVVAHPSLVRERRLVETLLEAGAGGLEAYHSQHTANQSRRWAQLADERGLLVTGGSDSHGPGGSVPVEIGSVYIPHAEQRLAALLSWAQEQGRWPASPP